jgi:Tfp pilus assembly protein PilO
MLSSNERRLLYILSIIVVVCGTGLFFFLRTTLSGSGLLSINNRIQQEEKDLQRYSSEKDDENVNWEEKTAEIDETIEGVKNKFFQPDETDLASFGLSVQEYISKNRLAIESQRTISGSENRKFLEFKVTGNAYYLSRFLEDVSEADKYWTIAEIIIKSNRADGNIEATMKITYETVALDET